MDASYDRKRYVRQPACVSYQTFVEAEAELSQPRGARGAPRARQVSRAPPPRRRGADSGGARSPPRVARGTSRTRDTQAHLEDASMDNSYSHLAKHMSQGDVLQDMTAGKPAFPVKPLDKAVVAHMGVARLKTEGPAAQGPLLGARRRRRL